MGLKSSDIFDLECSSENKSTLLESSFTSKMLAATLMKQQTRCLQGLTRQIISQNSKLPKNSNATNTLVPSQYLATTSVLKSGDHTKLWSAEKLVSALQIPAVIVPFMVTTPATDAIFCTMAVLHSHWGVEAIVVDYIRPSLFGGKTLIPNICQGAVWLLSFLTLGGLYYFNYTDVGFVNAIKMLWSL